MSELPTSLGLRATEVETTLSRFLDSLDGVPPRLIEAIGHSLFAGGKRLRPTLVLEWADALGGVNESALAAAGAIELIHTFSLVHDDLPAMDDDDLRRGRPTLHKAFDEATAILAGDAMMTLAFELIASNAEASRVPALVLELASASGPAGMIGGQVLDLSAEGKTLPLTDLQELHAKKTGALLRSACRLGAIAVGADEPALRLATIYGTHLGLAFQIVDDILDVTATPEQLGKATNKDVTAGKNTYPQLLGLDESRRLARQELHDALAALDSLGPRGETLAAIARFVVEREK